MASLAEKTKDTNTFRFKSFGDRVNEIDLRRLALYHIGHRNEELEEAEKETYFQQTLQKWIVLNLTEEYNYFSKRCRKIVTLPQLLHQKDFVIDLLLERLATATNLSQQPLLELLYVLARDLREEFYQYFQRVLDRLICLLNTQDSEQLEWTLICLAHLFKTLKPYLKRNIGVVFNAILPLLDEQHYAEHVTNFAVECFAYIARDVRDFPRFLAYVLKTVLREQVESVNGCGRLIYEILRGVNGQLHNSAGELFAQILEVLVNKDATYTSDQTDLLADILEHTLGLILPYVKTDQMTILWHKLCSAIRPDDKHIVNLMLPLVNYKDGRYVSESNLMVSTLLKQLDEQINLQQSLTSLITKLLTATHVQLTQLDASRLLSKLLSISQKSVNIYESSILELLNYQQFELLVLPHVIAHYEDNNGDLASLELLARVVIHKRPLQIDATTLSQWQIYPLQLKKKSTINKLVKDLSSLNINKEEHLLLLLLVPHLRGFSKDFLEKSIQKAIEEHLSSGTNENLVLLLLLQTYSLLKYKLPSNMRFNLHEFLLLTLFEDLWSLACLQLLLLESTKKDLNYIDETKLALALLLSHPRIQYRRMSSHCLQLLGSLENSKTNPYSHFHAACSVQPTVHNYRELLLHLQQLEPSSVQFKDFTMFPHFKEHTISLLLGLLYNNFKFIWAPVQQLLAAYVKEMEVENFWLIFKQKLMDTVGIINPDKDKDDTQASNERKDYISSALTLMLMQEEEGEKRDQTLQQALTYRQLLWQCIPKLGHVAEVKNRDIVSLFLEFVEEEYHGQLQEAEYTWNVNDENEELQLDPDDDDNDNDDDAEEKAVSPSQNRRKRKIYNTKTKFILQTLQLKLACFTNQPNPKALYRQEDLQEFYLELLAGPNPQLQQLALDCLANYKQPPALVQHKSSLAGLIDEMKFKSTLSTWNLSNLQNEERAQLLPFVLRLLYGKMLTKGSQKQLSAQQRKTLILRFLGQLEETEIFEFLQMAFGRYNIFMFKSIDQLNQHVISLYTPSAVIAAKQLQRIVNLLELIRKEFAGRLSSDFQNYVLKLLILVGSVSQQVINGGGKLMVAYKNVKHAGLQTMVNYFQQLVDMHELWQEPEIKAICDVYIWPILPKLSQDSIHNPTPLLKLLLLWGSEVNYQKWLKRKPNEESEPIIQHLMDLLLNDKAKPVVRKSLLQLIEQILDATAIDEYKEEALSLIRPYIPQILKHLQANWQRHKKSGKQLLDKRELNILTILTNHVDDPNTCDLLLQLVLPIFLKQVSGAGPEMVIQLITTLSNLLKRVNQPYQYVNQLAPLFEMVQVIPARKMLCEILKEMAMQLHKSVKEEPQLKSQATSLREWARLVYLMNAWDKRWLEQPDYDKRLEGLKEIKEMVENKQQLDLQLAVLVVYNCFYMLRHDKDLGLRVNIGELLKALLPQLTTQLSEKDRKFWLDDTLIPMFQRYIRDDKHEHARSEAISILGEMARQCPPESHEIFRDLAPLTDKHDLEVDFFENILHLQTQRHGRALQRIVTISAGKWRQNPPPAARTLTHILMPLTTRYLLNDRHIGKHTLIDAAIEAVGVMCEFLPWQQYHAILRYYLNKLRCSQTHQKQCVRLVVRILDGFHFDLTQGQTDLEMLKQLKEKLNESVETTKKVKEETKQEETDETSIKEDDDLDFDAEVEEEQEVTETIRTSQQLSANAAKRVMATITSILLPALNRSITEKTNYDTKHKVNRRRLSYEREEEDIQRVPIALAMVKLLQKLPSDVMDNSLPGIFMKVCTFLRSPLKSVRMLTRDILKKIMLTLGGSYLGLLLEQLQSLLTRGFQVHVLSVTLHGVLDALKGDQHLKPSHIENCLQNLLEVALNDIFGDVSAEKEVEKIVAHTPEAKPSAKSYLTLNIAARHIRDNCLLDLLLPFKEHLVRSQSRKVTQKIQECFAKIVAGLVENPHIARESLLIFIYGTMSESISDLMPGTQKRQLTAKEQALMRRARPDCLLLQPAPSRRSVEVAGNKQVKSNAQANAHILIEFGLELLHFVLKRKKLNDLDYEPFLQPLLPLLKDSLASNHARTTTYALKCYTAIWLGDYKLSELGPEELQPVVKRMFEILKNFSTFGATKQEENAQLVRSTFKAVVALLRKCEDFQLSNEQIEQLLLHIEQELQEGECSSQSMCFTLLKALVNRKIELRSLHDLMRRLADLTIISQSDYVRDESRGILLIYIMEYTLQKRVDQLVKFMSVQLCYSQTAGRQSAIQFMHSIINKFPQQILAKHSEFLYLSLGTRLVNDEDPECRRKVASALEALLSRLTKLERQPLLDVTMLFFTTEQETKRKAGVREMAAALLSRFVAAEKSGFADRLPEVLPVLVNVLTIGNAVAGGRFVRAPGNLSVATSQMDGSIIQKKKRRKLNQEEIVVDPDAELEEKQRSLDHQIIQLQYCLLKIFEHCGESLFTNETLSPTLDELAFGCQRFLGHDHNWVRCNAAKLLTQILSHYDYDYVGQQLAGIKREQDNNEKSLEFIYLQPARDIKSLVLDLCAQCIPGETSSEMIDELAKIILYIAQMMRDVPFGLKQEIKLEQEDDENETQSNKINLYWLVRNMRFLINREVAKAPHDTTIRTALFTVIEGLSTLLSVDAVTQLAPALLQALVREMSEEDQNVDKELRQLALRVGSRLRKRIGSDVYDKLRNTVQTKLMVRRAERRKAVAQEKIHDPERAAKRKAGVQERKKAAKRLKTAVIRGKAPDTKQKLKKRKRDAELEGF